MILAEGYGISHGDLVRMILRTALDRVGLGESGGGEILMSRDTQLVSTHRAEKPYRMIYDRRAGWGSLRGEARFGMRLSPSPLEGAGRRAAAG